ncbi:ubiquitin-associated and SH3 domain-containing protein B [Lingula anatina]|uniref:Ubiquitin-associated and SH3 domain-containing protein B n=1 Tax=Lingula anatina TaxID=7574 RepID=A0A1S3K9E2_LINAN|nr:ubiquitin-associated and SH3 domain-containing protein B [Lingula anatina]|eukprot:XP_013419245.1 ubiquitin-associated and SH3 domain-containing protein B [Lingula anatina]
MLKPDMTCLHVIENLTTMAGPAPDSHHELYKNARRASLSSPKGTSSLDILLQMGFSRLRAEKAIVATGDRGGNLAADWLLSHINDPNLDFDMPREFVLYLCPTGDLATDLDHYWKNTLAQCGWNGAHNFLPHITLCPFFKAKDSQVPHILRAVEKQREKRYPTRVDLNHFTAPNFIGLFVGEKCAAVLRNLVAEFAEDVHKSGVQMEAHQKQLHVTLAYQYSPEQHALLEKLSKNIKLDTPTRWDLRLYSRDARAHGTEVRRVLYAYQARQDDELDLILGDFIYMSPLDTGDPEWRQGVSWLTGCSGKFPLNHTSRSPESKTWTLHKSVEVISKQQPTSASGEHHVVAEGSKDVLYAKVQKHPPPRVLIVVRHGERMDQNFGYSWMDGCYNGGVYVRKDLNMPKTIPVRKGGPMDYQKDCPLTVIGTVQAKMTGEALKEQGVTFSHVYASPSFRCVQTAHYLLKGVQMEAHQKQLHVTLAYQYSPEQHALLEKLSKSIKLDTPTRWDLRLYSRDARAHGTEVRRVLYAYQARQDDELDLILGDFIYMSPLDTGDPEWRQGVSWLTGCSGKFPLNHTSRSPESKTWTLHKSVEVISKQQPTSASGEHHVVAEGSKDVLYAKVQKHPPPRVLIVVRHGERMDQNFGYSWMDGCYNGGVYVRKDLNMPKTIPVRKGGPMDYQKDCPLTVIGTVQAKMTGEALKEQGVTFSHVYASPSFRCVQTAHYLLKGLGQDCVIRVEDGLFEWCGWYKPGMPVWFTPAELRQNGYNVDSQYSPHYPAKKLTPDESIDDYYQRCYHVTKTMLKSHEKEGGNILIVGHAGTAEVCTRQLTGHYPRPKKAFLAIAKQMPFCGICFCEETLQGKFRKWCIQEPPVPILRHGHNIEYNWKMLL